MRSHAPAALGVEFLDYLSGEQSDEDPRSGSKYRYEFLADAGPDGKGPQTRLLRITYK
jgi:hypothetical protein